MREYQRFVDKFSSEGQTINPFRNAPIIFPCYVQLTVIATKRPSAKWNKSNLHHVCNRAQPPEVYPIMNSSIPFAF